MDSNLRVRTVADLDSHISMAFIDDDEFADRNHARHGRGELPAFDTAKEHGHED